MASRVRSRAVALVLGLGLLAGSSRARADEPVPPAPDTNPSVLPETPAQPNLLLIGAVVTAGWYGGAVGLSYLWPDNPGASELRYPVAGPYMALAKTGCGDGEIGCGPFLVVVRTVLTTLTAVGQTGGVLAMVEGIFLPTTSARAGAGATSTTREAQQSSIQIAPMVSGTGSAVGLGLNGSF